MSPVITPDQAVTAAMISAAVWAWIALVAMIGACLGGMIWAIREERRAKRHTHVDPHRGVGDGGQALPVRRASDGGDQR